jgi:tetratricopeptide (TPR) repeat protein
MAAIVLVVGAYFTWRLLPFAQATVKQADTLNEQGKYDEAFAKLQTGYNRALRKGDKTLLLSRMAATKSNMGQYSQAVEYYKQVAKMQPEDLATQVSLGEQAALAGDKPAAIAAYQKAVVLVQKLPQTDRTKFAIKEYNRAIEALQQ